MATATKARRPPAHAAPALSRIAVGVDGFPEGRDAATLGARLARPADADLLLIAVHPEPIVVLPSGLDWRSQEQMALAALRQIRDKIAPEARTMVKTDVWIARALQHAVKREHRQLLVMGSSRQAPQGRVQIGPRTRQLLGEAECALAVAPRGYARRGVKPLQRIGVGYDGGPESQAAVALAASLARSAGAELHLLAVVDDRMPTSGFKSVWNGPQLAQWEEAVATEEGALKARLTEAVKTTGAVHAESARGHPADRLLELSSKVDLIVLGSRRWGPAARVLLGSTGEALMHEAACPVLVVPRPRA